jgi:competence protein ComEA
MKKFILTLSLMVAILLGSGLVMAKTYQGQLNINTATVTELDALPGIGASKAQAIVDFRQDHPFSSVEELLVIKGIGEKLLAKLSPFVVVKGDSTFQVVSD